MSEQWTRYTPKLALYDILGKPGGITVETALQRAENAVESHRDKANAQMEQHICALEEIVRARGTPDPDKTYEHAAFVLDVGGMFAPPLCRAATSLCELIHRMKSAGRWDWPSIAVHVGALRALVGTRDERAPEVQAVLQGLAAVAARFPDPSPPDSAPSDPPPGGA